MRERHSSKEETNAEHLELQSIKHREQLHEERLEGKTKTTTQETIMTDTIFDKIIRREIPATIVYEDEQCLAFKDIAPKAPVHILIIPKKSIAKLSDAKPEDQALLGHILLKANEIAAQLGYDGAYRLVCNSGQAAGQEVFHLHFHLLAGRPLSWPPG